MGAGRVSALPHINLAHGLNGRFVFSSRESLSNTIKELQSQEIKSVEDDFEIHYQNNEKNRFTSIVDTRRI